MKNLQHKDTVIIDGNSGIGYAAESTQHVICYFRFESFMLKENYGI